MKLFFKILVTFLFLISLSEVKAQGYSVQANIQVSPPYSVYLSDYVAPAANKISVNLLMNDLNPNYSVKLKFTIKGEGITIESKPNSRPTPLFIQGGSMEVLSGADLAFYFDPANLNFYGLKKEQFIKAGLLPEGIYQFCVQAVEYNTSVPLSNIACGTAWLILNDPPNWIIPQQNERVKAIEPQNILFSWLPMHTGSPNSAFTTEYEFTMVEIWPQNRNANDAINVSLPFYKTTTINTSLFYGPAELPLTVGRRYACRLKAYDRDGRDLFKNNGYSEVLTFTYGDECKPPVDIKALVESYSMARISWTSSPGNTEYLVRFRVKNNEINNPWYENRTTSTQVLIDNLRSGLYEYSVKAVCSEMNGAFTKEDTFRIEPRPINNFDCGQSLTAPALLNTPMKTSLTVGEVIRIAGFDIKVTSINGSNGVFSGKGIMVMPFMDNVQVSATISQISLNESNQVVDGRVILDNAIVQLLDQETRDKITEVLGAIDQQFDRIEPYLQNTDQIVDQATDILNKVKEIPDATRKVIQDGKDMIAKGKDLIAQGTDEAIAAGKELIEKGKQLIKDGLNGIGGGNQNGSEGDDKNFKELIAKLLSQIKLEWTDNLSKVKSEISDLSKQRISAKENFKKRNKDIVVGNYQSVSMTENYPTGSLLPVQLTEQERTELLKDENYKKYMESSAKMRLNIETTIRCMEIIVVTGNLLNEDNLNMLVKEITDNFASDLKDLSKSIISDTLKGKNPDLEKKIREYLDKKVNSMIAGLNK